MVFVSLCRVMERSEESSTSTQCFCGSSSFVFNVWSTRLEEWVRPGGMYRELMTALEAQHRQTVVRNHALYVRSGVKGSDHELS